ncbi:ABC transporter substrate-binding protein [Paenibacillaceae bacterium WGS1546]|uniref:ABC transporter substrate-binding protein n=1 Tax=Cohnella sp. WGS1546 TaxID=3366810 RepID=UPI00372CEC64
MNRMKKWGISLSAIALVATMTACGSSNDQNGAASANTGDSGKGGEQIKLGITWAGSQNRHTATLNSTELYSKLHPNVTFSPDYMGFDTYFTKLATLSAAKNLPDIIQIDTSNIVDYAQRGQFLDLGGTIDTSAVDKTLVSAGMVDGKQYGIPIGSNAIALMYNKTALDKLGVNVPAEGLSWDEWIEAARKVQPKLEKGKYLLEDFSISTITQESDKYEIYQLSKGKGFLTTEDGKFNIDRDTFVEFNNLFEDLRKEGLVPPADVTVAHKAGDPKLDNFLNGTTLIKRDYAAAFPSYNSVNPGQYAITVVPHAEHSGAWLVPTQFFAVSADTKHPDEAKAYIDWFINDKDAGAALGLSRGVVVNKSVLETLQETLSDQDKAQIDIIDRTAPVANQFPGRPQGYGVWTDEYAKVSQALGFGQIDPEKAFDQLKQKWDEIVK